MTLCKSAGLGENLRSFLEEAPGHHPLRIAMFGVIGEILRNFMLPRGCAPVVNVPVSGWLLVIR